LRACLATTSKRRSAAKAATPIASRNQAEFAVRASSEKPVERMAAGSTRSE